MMIFLKEKKEGEWTGELLWRLMPHISWLETSLSDESLRETCLTTLFFLLLKTRSFSCSCILDVRSSLSSRRFKSEQHNNNSNYSWEDEKSRFPSVHLFFFFDDGVLPSSSSVFPLFSSFVFFFLLLCQTTRYSTETWVISELLLNFDPIFVWVLLINFPDILLQYRL